MPVDSVIMRGSSAGNSARPLRIARDLSASCDSLMLAVSLPGAFDELGHGVKVVRQKIVRWSLSCAERRPALDSVRAKRTAALTSAAKDGTRPLGDISLRL
jgi:hypothetical protein